MSLSLSEISSQLSPDELAYVMEKALNVGPFTVESVGWDERNRSKTVMVKFRNEKTSVVEVPVWRTSMMHSQ
jgi:uncharacterized Fe-S radical SAM superfamily protein PflX